MKITVATGFDRSYSGLGEFTARINMAYARKHGYDFVMYQRTWDRRPASWHKLLFARQQLPYCNWLLWLDADACGVGKIDGFIKHNKFLVAGNGPGGTGLNMGIFLLRNCRLSHKFLKACYSQTQFVKHRLWETAAARRIVQGGEKNGFFRNMVISEYGKLWCTPRHATADSCIVHAVGDQSMAQKGHQLQQTLKRINKPS